MGRFIQGPRSAKITLWKFPITRVFLWSLGVCSYSDLQKINKLINLLVFSNWLSKTETQPFIKCSLGFHNTHGKGNRLIKSNMEKHWHKTFSLPRAEKSLETFFLGWAGSGFG